jgi:hypothetical protein
MNKSVGVAIAMILLASESGALASNNSDINALTPMDLISSTEKIRYDRNKSDDDKKCDEIANSKYFGDWVKAYVKGDQKAFDKSWASVLYQLKDRKRISHLFEIANERTMLLDTASTNNTILWLQLLSSTEKAVGPNHRFIADVLFDLSAYEDGIKDYKTSLRYLKRAKPIVLRTFGSDSPRSHQVESWINRDEARIARNQSLLQAGDAKLTAGHSTPPAVKSK